MHKKRTLREATGGKEFDPHKIQYTLKMKYRAADKTPLEVPEDLDLSSVEWRTGINAKVYSPANERRSPFIFEGLVDKESGKLVFGLGKFVTARDWEYFEYEGAFKHNYFDGYGRLESKFSINEGPRVKGENVGLHSYVNFDTFIAHRRVLDNYREVIYNRDLEVD